MAYRFRRSARLGPLRVNFGKGSLSSISVGGRGASFNIPVARSGGPRTTVGLPGTGLSRSMENTPDRPVVIPADEAPGLPTAAASVPVSWRISKLNCWRCCTSSCFRPVPPVSSSGSWAW
ncbi:MAG: DUF4236 domain-containing protein [Synechococcaceae cyanobacterium ELA182]|jgi:Protein of unknown function (DUF4236)